MYMTKRDVDEVFYMFDPNLTWKAKGLMTYLLTTCDGAMISIRGISKYAKDGRAGTQAAMEELIAAGYIEFNENTYVISDTRPGFARNGGN